MPTGEQLSNAGIIINVGSQLGANSKQLLAAIEAALVESGLVNVHFGDRDSLGLFQQRPSQGWGSQSDVLDPYYAARAFFVGAGTNKGALEVSQAGTAGQLAQRVQRSAFPGRYDQKESVALGILSQLGAQTVVDTIPSSVYDTSGNDAEWPIEDLSASGSNVGTYLLVGVIAIVGLIVITR